MAKPRRRWVVGEQFAVVPARDGCDIAPPSVSSPAEWWPRDGCAWYESLPVWLRRFLASAFAVSVQGHWRKYLQSAAPRFESAPADALAMTLATALGDAIAPRTLHAMHVRVTILAEATPRASASMAALSAAHALETVIADHPFDQVFALMQTAVAAQESFGSGGRGRNPELPRQWSIIKRLCALPAARESLLRIGYALDSEATPDALVAWAARAGDLGVVACDLLAERGSIEAALPDLRALFRPEE